MIYFDFVLEIGENCQRKHNDCWESIWVLYHECCLLLGREWAESLRTAGMTPKLKLIRLKYPQLLHQGLLIQCGDGWADIIDRLLSLIQHDVDSSKRGGKPVKVKIYALEEKWGRLQVEVSGHACPGRVVGMIAMAEDISSRICEACGCADPAVVGVTLSGPTKVCCKGCQAALKVKSKSWQSLRDLEKAVPVPVPIIIQQRVPGLIFITA